MENNKATAHYEMFSQIIFLKIAIIIKIHRLIFQ